MAHFLYPEPGANDLCGDVLEDVSCRKCGYNLRGLPKEGRCPECGTAVGISLCGDLLRFSHPRWLQRVADGLMLVLWGVLVAVVAAVLGGVLLKSEPVLRQMIVALASVVGLVGTWQMTTPDPSGVGEAPGLTARKLVRAAVMASVAANVVQLMATSGTFSLGAAVISGLCGIVAIVGEFAKLHYIGLLAARLPDFSLQGRATSLKWGLAICYGLLIVLGVLVAMLFASTLSAGRGGTAAGGMMALGCMILPVAVTMIVLAILTLVLIYRTATAIRRQIPVSVELWKRAAQQSAKAEAAVTAAPGGEVDLPSDSVPKNERPYF